MNAYLYSFLALDIARERSREAERHWLAVAATGATPARRSRLRHLVAQLLAAVSRGSAVVVRRLDASVSDDLRHALAATE